MKTVIMAGGLGKRIQELDPTLPKPLINIAGKPILQWEIECLVRQGFTDIILTVSHMAEKIQEYFKDGSTFNCRIEYFLEEKPLGNAGALFKLWEAEKLNGDFLLLNADSMFDVDLKRFVDFHEAHEALATLFTHPNNHPYDSTLIIADENKIIRQWLTKEDQRPKFYKNCVNAGLHIISTELLRLSKINPADINPEHMIDLDRDLLKPLITTNRIYSYSSPEYVKDMGTPERFKQVCDDIESGKVQARNLSIPQKAIFLDRDGTINKDVGFLTDINKFELIPSVTEAIRRINNSECLCIVITNQPVVARGEVTFQELDEIHKKMETLLGEQGAYIDALYYCPHHPDKGFEGEIPDLKINCNCRKPKPGMLLQAADDFNINLSASWMIGDSERDIKAGRNAGCRTVLFNEQPKYGQDKTTCSLIESVDEILQKDTRVIFTFENNIEYTVSDVVEIYNYCKEEVRKTGRNNLKELYALFDIRPKNKFSLGISEIEDTLSEYAAICVNSLNDRASFYKEIKKARRKFFYWDNVDVLTYDVIDELYMKKNSKRKLKYEIPRDRNLYNQLIALTSYLVILRSYKNNIENHKQYLYKADYEFTKALKYFSTRYAVTDNLYIDTNAIFENIYDQICLIGPLEVFKVLYYAVAKNYDRTENRVIINSSINTEFQTLWHLTLKALTDSNIEKHENATYNNPKQLIEDVKHAIILLDVKGENDLSLLLPNQDDSYLKRLIEYSSVYDFHQYDINGMLFLIKHILYAFPDEVEAFFQETADDVYHTIENIIKEGQNKFLNGEIYVLSEGTITAQNKSILDKMVTAEMLNKDFVNPLQWENVTDDSEWIIKLEDKYYILPPVLSMLGVYDKIGKVLEWPNFGPQLEIAVRDLFSEINDLNVYSGKYIFEDKVFDCDAIVRGNEYALIIECKRKGLTRKGRSNDQNKTINDIAEAYFSSQRQAYHTHRAILENNNKLDLYPSECNIKAKSSNKEFETLKQTIDFSSVNRFIRISCTGGNFWIAGESGIDINIEDQIDKNVNGFRDIAYIANFIEERDKLLKKVCTSGTSERIVKLDKMFISFDKLYALVNILHNDGMTGDSLLSRIFSITRTQSKTNDTFNHMNFFSKLMTNSHKPYK